MGRDDKSPDVQGSGAFWKMFVIQTQLLANVRYQDKQSGGRQAPHVTSAEKGESTIERSMKNANLNVIWR